MTPQTHHEKLLIVEDDPHLAEMIHMYFNMQGYSVTVSGLGREAVDLARTLQPDLIILDVRLPDIDGFEVREQLASSHRTRNIPVLFLTERSDRVDRLKGLGLGVVDYITKPFDIQEVRLRVHNTLQRAREMMQENPVTDLPEGVIVREALSSTVSSKPNWAAVLVTLNGLNTFRELYGFLASDDVLRVSAWTINNAAVEVSKQESFAGHLLEHSFLVLLTENDVESYLDLLSTRLVDHLDFFYPGNNRGSKASTDDRLSLWAAVHTAADGPFASDEDLIESLLEARQPMVGSQVESRAS